MGFMTIRVYSKLPYRLKVKIDRWINPPCWEWIAAKIGRGYGQSNIHGERVYAHRLIFELMKGPIPERRQIDHICRNKLCVNPSHLRIVTADENMFFARREFCRKGHPLKEPNLEITRNGKGRACKACRVIYRANAYKRKKLTSHTPITLRNDGMCRRCNGQRPKAPKYSYCKSCTNQYLREYYKANKIHANV